MAKTMIGPARLVALASQLVLGLALVALVAGSRWLADPLGVVTFVLGSAGLVAGVAVWQRTGRPWLLAIADAWFVAHSLALFQIEANVTVEGLESNLYDPAYWHALADLGGPQLSVGVVWFAIGIIGAFALARTTRSASVNPDRLAASPRR